MQGICAWGKEGFGMAVKKQRRSFVWSALGDCISKSNASQPWIRSKDSSDCFGIRVLQSVEKRVFGTPHFSDLAIPFTSAAVLESRSSYIISIRGDAEFRAVQNG
jgi:hypothetical protein